MKGSVDLNRIADFLKIADFGNISKAAVAMGERKAKLSRNLALLEQELGVQLVYRTTRQFRLTEAGVQFYKDAREQLDKLETSILGLQNWGDGIEGKIKVTAPEDVGNFILTPIISEFRKAHPKTEFELVYTNQVLDLVQLGVDVAFRIGHLSDSSLVRKKVGAIDMVLVCSPIYYERHGSLHAPEQLLEHQTIGFSSAGPLHWKLTSTSARRNVKIKPSLISNSHIAIRDLTLLGHGISFLPRFLAEKYLASGELIRVLRGWGNEGLPIQVTMPHQKNIPNRIRRFFDFSAKKISELL